MENIGELIKPIVAATLFGSIVYIGYNTTRYALAKKFNFKYNAISPKFCNPDTNLTFEKATSPELFEFLRQTTKMDRFYKNVATVRLDELFTHYVLIKKASENKQKYLDDLVELLDLVYSDVLKSYKEMETNKIINYDMLFLKFYSGLKVTFNDKFGTQVCGKITSTRYEHNHYGDKFTVSVEFLCARKDHFTKYIADIPIDGFEGVQDIDDLPLEVVNDGDTLNEFFLRRSEKILEIINGHHMKKCKCVSFLVDPDGDEKKSLTGKVMIDIENYVAFNPNSRFYVGRKNKKVEIDLATIYPLVPIYSFENKCWGVSDIENFIDVEFDESIYDNLIMEPIRKDLILAISKHSYTNTMVDNVTGIEPGCIMLLQGASGTGKTSTAKMVSEKIHAPLYTATSGELGTTPNEIEESLENIFKLVFAWKAIFLLDEADVFLECRDNYHMERNNIVAIFLRMLDKFTGVMFLTTNRVDAIDPAFNSRISIQFDYDNLSTEQRKLIWTRNLECNKIELSNDVIDNFSVRNVNGRQIKNIVKLSTSLAIHAERQAHANDFETIFNVGKY